MKIIDMLRQEKPSLSFEVFPPKAADKYDSVEAAAAEIAKLKPSFMSITYGAGGGTSQYTVDIASTIQNTYHVNALAHLTCVSSTREHVRGVLDGSGRTVLKMCWPCGATCRRTACCRRTTATRPS